jgi:hypothetical protein
MEELQQRELEEKINAIKAGSLIDDFYLLEPSEKKLLLDVLENTDNPTWILDAITEIIERTGSRPEMSFFFLYALLPPRALESTDMLVDALELWFSYEAENYGEGNLYPSDSPEFWRNIREEATDYRCDKQSSEFCQYLKHSRQLAC